MPATPNPQSHGSPSSGAGPAGVPQDRPATPTSEFEPTAGETQRVLKDRAVALARPPKREADAAETLEVVEFMLAHENYAIESKCLQEVHPLKDLTPLPCVPPFVLGLINVRGRIIAVINLKVFFELPGQLLTDLNKVLIVRSADAQAGFLADAVLKVRSLPRREIQTSVPTLTGIRSKYIVGVTRERMVILDVARILTDERIIVDEATTA